MSGLSRKNITLCGVKHAGKSSAAKALSELTGSLFSDSDDALRELYCRESGKELSVREIYRELGEEGFRKLEVRALRNLFQEGTFRILALGGGVLSNPFLTSEDRKNMGYLCCIDVPDEVAYERVVRGGLPPFLNGKENPYKAFCEMNQSRRSVFREAADLIVEPAPEGSPEETAKIIISNYEMETGNE